MPRWRFATAQQAYHKLAAALAEFERRRILANARIMARGRDLGGYLAPQLLTAARSRVLGNALLPNIGNGPSRFCLAHGNEVDRAGVVVSCTGYDRVTDQSAEHSRRVDVVDLLFDPRREVVDAPGSRIEVMPAHGRQIPQVARNLVSTWATIDGNVLAGQDFADRFIVDFDRQRAVPPAKEALLGPHDDDPGLAGWWPTAARERGHGRTALARAGTAQER